MALSKIPELRAALADWAAALGEEHVIVQGSDLELASTATYSTEHRVTAILRPADVDQVSHCLKVAQRRGVPVYPISGGKNWGYGSRVPTSAQTAILDLRRMNRILDFSEEMGTVTLEPGVSFEQLEDFLDDQQSQRFMSAPGTTPLASVIGNALERGWGLGPYSDRFDFMCGMQVVLPEGDIVETGLERFEGSKSSKIFRWGVGPWFDGMFTQSNLGVVTRMTIFLAPKPSHFISFLYRFNDVERLAPLLDSLRELKMRGILRTNFKLKNFYRKLMDRGPYPYTQTNNAWSLTTEMEEIKKVQYAVGTWNGTGALYCWSKAQAAAERELVELALAPSVDHLLFLDQETLERKEELRDEVKAKTGYNLDSCLHRYFVNTRFIGVDKGLGTVEGCWRQRTPAPFTLDLDADKEGLIFVAPIVPFRGRDVRESTELAAAVQRRHGFDSNLALNCVTERSIVMTAAIIYDRDVAGDDERAMACAQDMTQTMMAAGYTLVRLNTFNMDIVGEAQAGSRLLQEKVKAALDPGHILAPGRYEV